MIEHVTVMIRKGQITIPAPKRQALRLQVGDRVTVTLHADGARLSRQHSPGVVARTAGLLGEDGIRLSIEEEPAAFEQAVAEEVTGQEWAATSGGARLSSGRCWSPPWLEVYVRARIGQGGGSEGAAISARTLIRRRCVRTWYRFRCPNG